MRQKWSLFANNGSSLVVRGKLAMLDGKSDRVTDRIVRYASEVVEATPHYHMPGLWVYDEEGEVIGTTEGFGMNRQDEGVFLDHGGSLSGHLEGQAVCLTPPASFGGVAPNNIMPFVSSNG